MGRFGGELASCQRDKPFSALCSFLRFLPCGIMVVDHLHLRDNYRYAFDVLLEVLHCYEMVGK